MTSDLRIRVDEFFASSKTLEGSWSWARSERTNVYKLKRQIAEDGVSYGFRLEVNAHVDTNPKEFRFLIIGYDTCLCRLDCAPLTDGQHINEPKRPVGFPFFVEGNNFHPWQENRVFSTAFKLSKRLPYALDVTAKIVTINQDFWQFCDLTGISATTADEPDWPNPSTLL